MFEYFMIFLSGVIAHWLGIRLFGISVFSKAMLSTVLTSLSTLKIIDRSLTEAHKLLIVTLTEAKASDEEIGLYKEISGEQAKRWREMSASALAVAISKHGVKWKEWNSWNSAMRFLDSFSKKDGE